MFGIVLSCNENSLDWTMVCTCVAAGGTLLLGLIAAYQLNAFNKTSKFEFYHKLKEDFFTDRSRELIMLISYEALEFVKGNEIEVDRWVKPDFCPYYLVRRDILTKINPNINLIDVDRKIYTLFEVEDYLLNQIEDLAIFSRNEVLDFREIADGFGVYVEIVMSCPDVQEHIKYLKQPDSGIPADNEIYIGANELYEKIKYYNSIIEKGKK